MKKSIFLIVGAFTLIIGTSTTNLFDKEGKSKSVIAQTAKENTELKTVITQADYPALNSPEQLFSEADLVVIGKPLDGFLDREHKVTFYEDGSIEDFYTETNIQVIEVIKAPQELNITMGSNFELVEAGVGIIKDSKGEKVKIVRDFYSEMKKNNRYLIFLKKNTFGDYAVSYNTYGKYYLDGQEEFEGNVPNNNNEELISTKEKKEKFKKEFKKTFNLN